MSIWELAWDRGSAQLHALGGMLGPAMFELEGGRSVQPFFLAPWFDEKGSEKLPGLMRNLRGEWPCVPFGIEGRNDAVGWKGGAKAIGDGNPHGFGANHDWELMGRGDSWVEIGIDYPETHPVRRLTRKVAGRPGSAALDVVLRVEARISGEIAIALHPTFRLPATDGAARIDVAGLEWGLAFPQELDATTAAKPGARFDSLSGVPAAGGGLIDLSRLPLESPNEDLLQIKASGGAARLANLEEEYSVTVRYDAALFPSVVVWITNHGFQAPPWSGRTRAIGIEPARSAFDFGQPVSADAGNPLSRAGLPTSIWIQAGKALSTQYAIELESLA
jgi:hypothetical protein